MGMGEHAVDAAEQLDLLLEGELGQQRVGFGLNCGRVRRRSLRGSLEGRSSKTSQQ